MYKHSNTESKVDSIEECRVNGFKPGKYVYNFFEMCCMVMLAI